jgi:predicted RecB family nuclease
MRITASDIYNLYQPSFCELRVFLKERGGAEVEPSEYQKVLQELGARHEKNHLNTLGPYDDISDGTLEARAAMTMSAVASGAAVIYQPFLRAEIVLSGEACEIVGIPDFLIRGGTNYRIRDAKISRHADKENHYETVVQINLYGWLFERIFGRPSAGLEVLLGDGTLLTIPYDGGVSALAQLQTVHDIKSRPTEFYDPVGWTKCGSCGFSDRCWRMAEASDDVSRLRDVDAGLARELHNQNVFTVDQLHQTFDAMSLSEFRRPWGQRMQRVGKTAESILLNADALKSGRIIIKEKPAIPQAPNYVVFDIEGMPPQLDELEKIYLWGLQVFGERPTPAMISVSGFGPDGDKQGWWEFLLSCSRIFDEHGDIPFLHWHHYEKTNLQRYVIRHGDADGTAARVARNLVNLLPITEEALVLPVPSYSLKVVEKFTGFVRRLEDAGGDWAMATYIRAVETGDEALRQELMERIIAYNKEDLEGTWATFQWLRGYA